MAIIRPRSPCSSVFTSRLGCVARRGDGYLGGVIRPRRPAVAKTPQHFRYCSGIHRVMPSKPAEPNGSPIPAILRLLLGVPVFVRVLDRSSPWRTLAENWSGIISSGPATTTASASCTAASCTHGKPSARHSGLAFAVDWVECRQRDIGDFFLNESHCASASAG